MEKQDSKPENQEGKKEVPDGWAPIPPRTYQVRFDVSHWVGDKMISMAAEKQISLQALTRLFIHEVLTQAGLISTPFPQELLVPEARYAMPAMIRNRSGELVNNPQLLCWVEDHELNALRQIAESIGQDRVRGVDYTARGMIALRIEQLEGPQGQARNDHSLKLVREYLVQAPKEK